MTDVLTPAEQSPEAPLVPLKPLGKVFAITSGKGGVGKTFVSASLAAALAKRGHKVLVLDADLELANLLKLTAKAVEEMAEGLRQVPRLPDPVGEVTDLPYRPSGNHVGGKRVPLGVIGIIYESRPNVTCDAGALCLKSGNAAILRGGSESHHSSAAIHACLVDGLRAADLPVACIQLVPTTSRAAVGYMLAGMTDSIDVIVPRGGKSLVARVQQEARVPVIGHLEGNCHVYVDRGADLNMARAIVKNAKLRRTGICGVAETLLESWNEAAGIALGPSSNRGK